MRQALFAILSLLFCGSVAQAAPLPVVASFSILGDMVKQIGGDAVDVSVLVGPDGDAHAFEPTPQDIKKIANARLVVVNGLGFEGWMDRLVQSAAYHGPVVVASYGVTSQSFDEDGKKVTDPHAWQDLQNGRIYIKNITAVLVEALPQQAGAIKARAAAYDAELVKMDETVRAQVNAVPQAKRKVITSHDAFGYFARAYGIEFLAAAGISTESEPGAAAIARLSRQMKSEGIKTVFLENMANGRLIKQLARDGGATVGGTLYADALSAKNGEAPTYFDMFRHNLPLLVAAMQQNS